MSTALQTAPHQPPSLSTSPLISTSSSGLPYMSSPYGETYHTTQQTSSPARPSSSKHAPRASRGGTDGLSASIISTPPSSASNRDMASRTTIASSASAAAASPEYQSHTPDRRRNAAPIAPPRTSSNQNAPGVSEAPRRAAPSNERSTASPRQARQPEPPRTPLNGNVEDLAVGAADDARASSGRRRQHPQMTQDSTPHASSSRDGRTAPPTQTLAERPNANDAAYLDDAATPPVVGMADPADPARRGGRSRHDHRASKRDKDTKFSDYILGNVIGEGEFGKVRLAWKQEDKVQVAIKIIKKESLGNNPSRLAKIHREVNILRSLQHPNIVHLYDMIGDDTRIGIVLEYASGGELFDYILNHRYLKDNAARRLFAQLISGVGYLHKKGIVHRDLKLENLLLDRHRNIIITDFGFANNFDPRDELTEEEEMNLSDREFIKRRGLDKMTKSGVRRGDLMQTSCGSPCYAAPELVVSDSVYTGRKVDVWSCGVILYAMLAGYLPFDDDPANPEGDNINLLYKYIVQTPLTFPEYVSPHARDLLRRILVPNPRKRADLFEVARHSWLSEYASVVRVITSSTTTPTDIQNTTVPAEDEPGAQGMARSASVRNAAKPKTGSTPSAVGGLATKHGNVDDEEAAAAAKAQKDAKRRTVQVEYVAPTTATQRGEYTLAGQSRQRGEGPVEATRAVSSSAKEKPLPRDPPAANDAYGNISSRQTAASHHQPQLSLQAMGASRPTRERPENTNASNATTAAGTPQTLARPQTSGSIQSSASLGFTAAGRSTYGQPAPPTMAGTNAQGRIQQPTTSDGHPSVPSKFARVSGFSPDGTATPPVEVKGHKRSSTIGDISSKLLGRSGSLFGKGRKRTDAPAEKNDRKYPPLSMANTKMMGDEPRQSIDSRQSRRSFSIGLGKKRSGSVTESQEPQEKSNRRFSLIPSITKAIGLAPDRNSHQSLPSQVQQGGNSGAPKNTPIYDQMQAQYRREREANDRMYQSQPQLQSTSQHGPAQYDAGRPSAVPRYMQQHSGLNTGSDPSVDVYQGRPSYQAAGSPYQGGFSQSEGYDGGRLGTAKSGKGVLQKTKRFDAYDDHPGREGSSGAAKRVMDFFRRRGKARVGDDR
ncbi:related to ser/thr protein kinase KIN4 [Cephalotrichum gorgonifer]|uniref:non-specific serine/threonine protein kinase n=1 Tax=Cephalotrichum gorgonifer TaxID=2041049 RepID=A0AAE8MXA3_9PEZI|nr:related to ser/thr protein kinase KIN4 [Cephalotrichum gorgonifer]